MVDKVALEQVFSEYFGSLCIQFHRLLHTRHHPSFEAGAVGQTVGGVPSGPSLTPIQEAKNKQETLWAFKQNILFLSTKYYRQSRNVV
jgi:hypothetical protein